MDVQASPDTDTDFGVINKTTDYKRFMYMGGNRVVDIKHVKEIQVQMERNREVFASLPILVNENWYIVDGQHRFEAAKAIGVPIYYIRQKHIGLSDARTLNIAQKRWSLKDFAQSYADSGRQDYIDFLRISNQHKRVPLSIVQQYLADNFGGGRSSASFRAGDFHIVDKALAEKRLDFVDEVMNITSKPLSQATYSALSQVMQHEDFNQARFLNQLREAPENLEITTSVRTSMRSIEQVFNRHNKQQIRLY